MKKAKKMQTVKTCLIKQRLICVANFNTPAIFSNPCPKTGQTLAQLKFFAHYIKTYVRRTHRQREKKRVEKSMECSSMVSVATFGPGDLGSNSSWFTV